jgi:hypothetical protein
VRRATASSNLGRAVAQQFRELPARCGQLCHLTSARPASTARAAFCIAKQRFNRLGKSGSVVGKAIQPCRCASSRVAVLTIGLRSAAYEQFQRATSIRHGIVREWQQANIHARDVVHRLRIRQARSYTLVNPSAGLLLDLLHRRHRRRAGMPLWKPLRV